MTARSGEEDDVIGFCVKYWGDNGDVGQMSREEVKIMMTARVTCDTDDPPA